MKTTETYYQVCLTEVLSYGRNVRRLMRLKFPTLEGAKGYARDLLDLLAEGCEGSCDKTCNRYEVYAEADGSKALRIYFYAEILDQDGKVQQI